MIAAYRVSGACFRAYEQEGLAFFGIVQIVLSWP